MIIFPTRFTTNYVYNDFPVNTYAKPLRLFSSLPSYGMWHMRVFVGHIWVLERVSYTVNKTLTISDTTKEIYVGNKVISKRQIRSNLIVKKCFSYIYFEDWMIFNISRSWNIAYFNLKSMEDSLKYSRSVTQA